MTYKEAIALKKNIGESVIEVDMKLWVFVVPANNDDFKEYLNAYRTHKKTDDLSKLFSKDGKFEVYGMWTDTASVYYKKLS